MTLNYSMVNEWMDLLCASKIKARHCLGKNSDAQIASLSPAVSDPRSFFTNQEYMEWYDFNFVFCLYLTHNYASTHEIFNLLFYPHQGWVASLSRREICRCFFVTNNTRPGKLLLIFVIPLHSKYVLTEA